MSEFSEIRTQCDEFIKEWVENKDIPTLKKKISEEFQKAITVMSGDDSDKVAQACKYYELAIMLGDRRIATEDQAKNVLRYIEFLNKNDKKVAAESVRNEHGQTLVYYDAICARALQKSPEYAASVLLDKAMNSSCFSAKTFAECTRFMHPHTQQTLFKVAIELILYMGNPNRKVDGRNNYSKEICQKIVELAKTNGNFL